MVAWRDKNLSPQCNGNVILALSIPQAILVIGVSCAGLLLPDAYSTETLNWQAQTIGQDAVDLFLVVPVLLLATFFAAQKNRIAWLLWSGVNLYLIYTFAIYCFNIHFSRLFIAYCFTLGLSFYSLFYFLYIEVKGSVTDVVVKKSLAKIIGIFFLVISVSFYFLWLSEIIPASVAGTTPKSLVESGLTTNPVHVIDLAIFLPGLFLVAVFAIKGKMLGFFLVPAMLVFMVLMSITIAVLIMVMKRNGFEGDYALSIGMAVLALISASLLIAYLR